MQEKNYSLEITSDLKNLFKVLNFSKEVATSNHLSHIETNRLRIAVYEVVSNIIEHTYKLQEAGHIKIIYTFKDDEIEIDIYDKGEKYNPLLSIPINYKKNINTGKTRGMGLYLVKKIAKQLDYQYTDDNENKFSIWMQRDINNTQHVNIPCC